MVVQTVALARHVAHHVAVDAIQVVIVVQHRPPVPVALVVAVVDVTMDVVANVMAAVMAAVLLIVKVVVVQGVQTVVVLHVLERVKKVAIQLVLANAEALHVLAFVQVLVTEASVMEVVLDHASHRAEVPAFILVI